MVLVIVITARRSRHREPRGGDCCAGTHRGLDLHVRALVRTHRRQEMQPASKLLTLILLIFMGTELTQVGFFCLIVRFFKKNLYLY